MTGTRTIDVLRRFWWLIASLIIAGGVFGGLPAPEQAVDSITRWSASHTILVSNSSSEQNSFIDPQQFNQLTLFTTTGQVPLRAAESLGFDGPPAALASSIMVEADQQSGAVRISTTQDTEAAAVDTADAFAEELISYLAERQDQLREDRLTSTLERLSVLEEQVSDAEDRERRDPEDRIILAELDALSRQYSVVYEQYNTLQADQSQLVLTTLQQAQGIAITERGLSAPRSRTSRGVLGGVVGGVVGFGLATLLARADRRLRTRAHAEQVVGLPAHAIIPVVDKKDADRLAVRPDRHDPVSDAYRRLRSIVAFTTGSAEEAAGRGSVTLVVSASPGDGKSSVSANLIAAYQETGARTIGINTDFRRPTLLRKLEVPASDIVGLTVADIRTAPLNLVTTPTDSPNLILVDLATMKGHSPGELARATAGLLPRLADVADAVVIDTSPIGATAEVLEFLPLVDNVILVVRLDHSSIKTVARTIETVRALSTANLLLAVIGGSSADSNEYYYQYTQTEAPTGRFRRKKPIPPSPATVEVSVPA